MIVRLTHAGFRAIELRMPPLYAEAMRAHRATRGRTQHDYDLPAIAWRQILDGMVAQCYGPAGGKLKGKGRPSDSAYLAIKRVAEAVKRMEGHPALRGASIEGWVSDVIPAWFSDGAWVEGRRMYWCYPHDAKTFALLVPQHSHNLGMKITRWEPTAIPHHYASGRSWTFDEASHLMFSRARAAV